jgi:signal transduction histidine kinase
MKKILFAFLLITGLHTQAQKTDRPLIDSLQQAITVTENDSVKARLYNRLYNELCFINAEEAMQYAKIGLAHAQKMKWQKSIAVFQNNVGRSFSDMGNYDSTFFYYNAALNIHSGTKDKYNMAVTNNNMGTAAQNIRSDYTTAVKYYFASLKLAEEMDDSTMLSVSLSNIARIYMLQKNYTKALEFDNKSLRIREKKGTPDEIASSLENIGKTYYSIENLPKAKEYLQKALALYEGTGNLSGLASVWSSLSLVFTTDYRSVVEARIKSKQLWNDINPMHQEAITNTGNLGLVYLDIVRYDTNHIVKYGDIIPDNKTLLLQKAEENLNAAIQLSTQTGDIDSKSFFTGVLAEVQELKGDFKNAFYNFKLFKETEDSLFSQENKNKIAAAESQREIDKKNSEIKINELALSNQQKTMWGLVGGLALLSIIGVLFYRQSQQRKKTNTTLVKLNTELDNANKVKAKFFAILSHDLRAPVANLISFLNLQKNEPDLLSPEQAAKHQKKITTSAEALLENMEAMLLWSKSQMENFKPVKNKVTSNSLFEQLSRNFSATDEVQINFPDGDGVFLTTDENYLLTIMQNLTANAVSALKNKPGAIINWKVMSTNDTVVFSIHDNGPGLPAEVISILNDNAVRMGSKNGLGFHIIKDMAKAIDCRITFESNTKGTLFNLELPA